MLTPPTGARIYLALAPVDMRKGFDGLAAQVQQVLRQDPFGGQLFLFRSRRGDRLKAVWWDGTGLCLFAKRAVLRVGGILLALHPGGLVASCWRASSS